MKEKKIPMEMEETIAKNFPELSLFSVLPIIFEKLFEFNQ